MSERDEPKPKTVFAPRTAALRARRDARLAEALRRNLKRRKDQSRGRESTADGDDQKK